MKESCVFQRSVRNFSAPHNFWFISSKWEGHLLPHKLTLILTWTILQATTIARPVTAGAQLWRVGVKVIKRYGTSLLLCSV